MTANNFRVLEKRGRGYDLVGNVRQWSEDSHRTTYTQRKGVLPMSYENIFPNTIHHLKKKKVFFEHLRDCLKVEPALERQQHH